MVEEGERKIRAWVTRRLLVGSRGQEPLPLQKPRAVDSMTAAQALRECWAQRRHAML